MTGAAFRREKKVIMRVIKPSCCLAVAACLASMASLPRVHGAEAAVAAPYEPTWESVNRHNPGGTAPEWFRDAKFGIYFHWGVYSVPAFRASSFAEWYPKTMNTPGTGENLHHIATYGDPSTWPYENFLLGAKDKNGNWVQFAPKLTSAGGKLDPEEFAQLFVDAGAKFAGPVFEHHDGISMWRSKVNEWNVCDKGPRLDTARLFVDAFRRKGLRIVAPLHHAFNVAGWYPTDNPAYGPAASVRTGNKSLQKLYGKLPAAQECQLWLDKLKEVIDDYEPDLMWHDVLLSALPDRYRLEYLAYYYNKARAWNREVLVTYKNSDLNRECAVLDFEGGGNADVSLYTWLSDSPVGQESWSYAEGMTYYSQKSMLHTFIDRVSKNGQLLLNISPKADGSIPQVQKDILLAMGAWLKKFGEAIYGTRAWTIAGEGPTVVDGPNEFVARDVRFTTNKEGTILYAIVGDWPESGAAVEIASLNASRIDLRTLVKAELLGETPGTYLNLEFAQGARGLAIAVPQARPYLALAYAFKLSFSGKIPPIALATAPPTFFEHDNFRGYGVALAEGDYTTAALIAAGIKNNDVSSVKVNRGWTVEMYDGDECAGASITVIWDVISLQAERTFGDTMSSVRIRREATPAPASTTRP
jgi:alpha-L-fucosidase